LREDIDTSKIELVVTTKEEVKEWYLNVIEMEKIIVSI
jgi:hypothetical protein